MKTAKILGIALLGAAISQIAMTPSAEAGQILKEGEFKVGFLRHDVGIFSSSKQDGLDINLEYQFASPDLLKVIGSPRPMIGANLATHVDSIHEFYAGLAWNYQFIDKFYVLGTFGGAIHTADHLKDPGPGAANFDSSDRYLGSRVLFHLAVGLGYRITDELSVELYADHISNANLADNNESLENAGVRFGFSF